MTASWTLVTVQYRPAVQLGVGGQVGEDVVNLAAQQQPRPEVSRPLPLQHCGRGVGALHEVTVILC